MIAGASGPSQLLGNARAPVSPALGLEDRFDLGQHLIISLIARARLAFLPRVIAAAAHAEKLAQISQGMLVGKSFDHSVTFFYASDRMPIVYPENLDALTQAQLWA